MQMEQDSPAVQGPLDGGVVQHTPGPWQVLPEESDKAYLRIRGTRLGLRYKIANVMLPNYQGALKCEAEESRANAELIAAAPDILHALRDLVDVMTVRMDGDTVALHNALAALRKATGVA
jgi:hypothetical protein